MTGKGVVVPCRLATTVSFHNSYKFVRYAYKGILDSFYTSMFRIIFTEIRIKVSRYFD